jgi:hypothetical protein
VGKHRHERFRPGYAVVRIDDYDIPGIPKDQLVTVKAFYAKVEREA